MFQSGAYREAQTAGERALEIRERLLGEDHPDVAASLDRLGLIYAARNDYVKADELCRRALAINERVFGSDHPAIAENLISLAKNARSKGNHAEAERFAKRAVSITTGHFGADHPMTAASLGTLADVYVFKTDYLASEKVADQALDIVARAFGPDDQTYADFALRASRAQLFLGHYARAEELTLLALKTTEGSCLQTVRSLCVWSRVLPACTSPKATMSKPKKHSSAHLTIYRKSFGRRSPQCRPDLNNLGSRVPER